MAMDLTGIDNVNEYYTNHYFSSVFEENAAETISNWRAASRESDGLRTPWSQLRDFGRLYAAVHERYLRTRSETQVLPMVKDLADSLLEALGYESRASATVNTSESSSVSTSVSSFVSTSVSSPVSASDTIYIPVYREICKASGAPWLWVILGHSADIESGILQGYAFDGAAYDGDIPRKPGITETDNEELITKALFSLDEPPRWLILIGINSVALVDRNKWNDKRYLHFNLDEIFSRREESTLQAMAVLLHRESLCPDEGAPLLDTLDDNSHRHASGVSQDLKYALREAIELLGNEVLYDMSHRQGRNLDENPVDAGQLTIECLRYMYRMLFVLFIEARPELGYAPMKVKAYASGYSFEHLRDVADAVRDEIAPVGGGYYLHETLQKLYGLIYDGYPFGEAALNEAHALESKRDMFIIEPLKAHIFDPEFTKMLAGAKLRNGVMLKIIDLMSISRTPGRRGRRGRISYSALGINQMGAVYEALLSYRGFIADETLFEVKRKQDDFDELNVGYFVPENELDNYDEDERVRYGRGENEGKLRKYEKGAFIYRLAGREREKSASYYTPEALTKCLVKYALKELLEGKTADEILALTICEPAMGSAAFLNEAVSQLAEAYIDLKQKETGGFISFDDRQQELQKVKMYIADRNVYGIDLNPTAVELAEVSLWLNTIYGGGYVPWFRTQIVNGNSLIGARRQAYRIEQLETDHAPGRWWENAPVRIEPAAKRMPKKQVYHFLMGDPSMAKYTDNVIKSLAPDEIKEIKKWNKKFILPYDGGDIETLLRISAIIDKLWEKQIALLKEVKRQTSDILTVYGQPEETESSNTTIREKDLIYEKLYRTEGGDNASPYARLKFAMDYWCSLWFWPINQADLLPTRSEFLFDMDLILEGGIMSVNVHGAADKKQVIGQTSMLPSEMDEIVSGIIDTYDDLGKVCLDKLCSNTPRLALARKIAEQQRFFHWELEFADIFAERGGFDLILGNPPWIKLEWNEKLVLSDNLPLFYIKDLTSYEIIKYRKSALNNIQVYNLYLDEYEIISGYQNFINATQNYYMLTGMKANLYKSFLPQAWNFCRKAGITAFLHPDGVYDDPNGYLLRQMIYPKLKRHYQFINELRLFVEIHHSTMFSINIYENSEKICFDNISNLFHPFTIDECYELTSSSTDLGIKDLSNKWNIYGNKDRIIKINKNELQLFAQLLDNNDKWHQARLLIIHTQTLLDVLKLFIHQNCFIGSLEIECYPTIMWNETNSQRENIIQRQITFPINISSMIYSGPHINVANPLFKTSRRLCILNSDYDPIDLTNINEHYLQRINYQPVDYEKYYQRSPITGWGTRCINEYKIVQRAMIGPNSERTLSSAIIPAKSAHIDGLYSLSMRQYTGFAAGLMASIPYDFFIKATGKTHARFDILSSLPLPIKSIYRSIISLHGLILNCLTVYYSKLWHDSYENNFCANKWSKLDPRLRPERFTSLTPDWTWDTPLRTDYERRQALVEIDVLTSLALGMTLEQLKTIYRIQFPVLQSYEDDTWYDRNGRIVFTNNRSLTGVGYSRPEWEQIKNAQSGAFTRTITDDTQPGGPIERTIEYVAPFDRCDREQDYETAWQFFSEKYKD